MFWILLGLFVLVLVSGERQANAYHELTGAPKTTGLKWAIIFFVGLVGTLVLAARSG